MDLESGEKEKSTVRSASVSAGVSLEEEGEKKGGTFFFFSGQASWGGWRRGLLPRRCRHAAFPN